MKTTQPMDVHPTPTTTTSSHTHPSPSYPHPPHHKFSHLVLIGEVVWPHDTHQSGHNTGTCAPPGLSTLTDDVSTNFSSFSLLHIVPTTPTIFPGTSTPPPSSQAPPPPHPHLPRQLQLYQSPPSTQATPPTLPSTQATPPPPPSSPLPSLFSGTSTSQSPSFSPAPSPLPPPPLLRQ
ncbi:hypothetical protein Pmani_019872 [Petrolisthes manimaculis]|uniref:Uncharacterized protein n=1 Tax=Petrolisthes manimaculis TaxID=1843537 RepID=A0AAE1U556_9EUCA|nr:hypothetical protein Pmani_019872 [Petrolisthes manimaculis]